MGLCQSLERNEILKCNEIIYDKLYDSGVGQLIQYPKTANYQTFSLTMLHNMLGIFT